MLDHSRILQSLDRILHLYFKRRDIAEATMIMLEEALSLTSSEYGFIGAVACSGSDCHTLLRPLVAIDRFTAEPTELDFLHLDGLCEEVLARQRVVISDAAGLVMHSFMGVPLFHGDEMIAMFGMANRPGGYSDELSDDLSPFYSTVGNIIHSHVLASRNRELSDRYRSLILNIPGVSYRCLCDKDWTMLFMSPAIAELSGYPPGEFIDNAVRTYESIIHPDDSPAVETRVMDAVEARVPWEIEYRIVCKDGRIKHVFERGRAIFDGPEVRFLDGFILDITDKKRAEEERVRFIAALEQARDAAEQAMRAKANFLAVMSHEIRTPLNGIVGAMEILSDYEHPDPEAQDLFAVIGSSCNHLAELLNNILDYSRIDDGQLLLQEQAVELASICTEVKNLFMQDAVEKGIELAVTDRLDHPAHYGDPLRIRQIVTNLLSNAIKFTVRGRVEIALFEQDGQVCIAVKDSGIGIAADKTEHIFGYFNQLDSSLARRFGGTGLGLAISRQLAELMGGVLTCESAVGHGSRFTFRAPLRVCRDPVLAVTVREERRYDARILVAEDNRVNQKILLRQLQKLGLRVDIAHNGVEAYEKAMATDYDLILMDMMMPEMDGKEATRRILATALDAPPIVALTANVSTADKADCTAVGMRGFLAKPVRRRELIRELDRHLRRRAGRPLGAASSEIE